VDEGHEVGMHGWIHERNVLLNPAAERDLAKRAFDTLAQTAGVPPVGIRTPSWDFSHHTLAISRDLRLAYDSSLMADDAPYFTMDRVTDSRPYTAPRQVLTIWRDEFDAAYQAGGLFQLTMHPHVIGHRSRFAVLSELVDHITSHRHVWFATHADIAQYVLANG